MELCHTLAPQSPNLHLLRPGKLLRMLSVRGPYKQKKISKRRKSCTLLLNNYHQIKNSLEINQSMASPLLVNNSSSSNPRTRTISKHQLLPRKELNQPKEPLCNHKKVVWTSRDLLAIKEELSLTKDLLPRLAH